MSIRNKSTIVSNAVVVIFTCIKKQKQYCLDCNGTVVCKRGELNITIVKVEMPDGCPNPHAILPEKRTKYDEEMVNLQENAPNI